MNLIKRLVNPFFNSLTQVRYLATPHSYSFAFMTLFENNKKPAELSPVFKKPERIKGHLRYKNRKGYVSPKLNKKTKLTQNRLKNHKGMLKRVKIVGPRWNRQFKRLHAERYHLRRKKSSSNLRRKKRAAYIHKADIKRVRKMIPYFKRQSLKQQY